MAPKIATIWTGICLSLTGGFLNAQTSDEDLQMMSFDELLEVDISVASNIFSDFRKQPVSVSVISKDLIQLSGARTLSELLTLYVPGYFLVEDQDDTIAGFRGVVADNNSKTMLLLNGVNLNTEWFWGAPDALLNGVDLDFIERIEVIRGPGSVTLGQGALIGVINIVTRDKHSSAFEASVSVGQDGYQTLSLQGRIQRDTLEANYYFSTGDFDGQQVPNRGWAQEHFDQGLSVFQRQHRLKRADYTNAHLSLDVAKLNVSIFQFKQQRDLYNFYRDREVVEQDLQGITADYGWDLNDAFSLEMSARYVEDEYALFSHGNSRFQAAREIFELQQSGFAPDFYVSAGLDDGLVSPGLKMGGTQETRSGIKLVANWNDVWQGHSIAFGAELSHFSYGENDSDGDNFIINEEVQRLGLGSDGMHGYTIVGDLNSTNTWAKPDSVLINSLFAEGVYQFNESLQAFWGVRYDDHPNWGSHLSPRLGILYDVNARHSIRLSWQSGFRGAVGLQFSGGFVQDGLLAQENFQLINDISATLVDFDFDGVAANDDKQLNPVEPEKLNSAEVAYSFLSDSFGVNAVLFFNTIEDILLAEAHGYQGLAFGDSIGTDLIGTWNGNWYYQNQAGELKQIGIELELEKQIQNIRFNLSHALVNVMSSDQGVQGVYIDNNQNHIGYPENVTRFRLAYDMESAEASWSLLYSMLYYWDYFSPLGTKQSGELIANVGARYRPTWISDRFDLRFTIKNIWDNDGLYPIKATGDITGSQGTPAIEERTAWLSATYAF